MNIIRITLIVLCVLLLCSCSPMVGNDSLETEADTPMPSSGVTAGTAVTLVPTVTPEITQTQGIRDEEKTYWQEIWNLLYDQGWLAVPYPNYIADWEEFMPQARSVFSEMMPYVFVLVRSLAYTKSQEDAFSQEAENDNDMYDAEHVSSVMCGVIQRCGRYHPDASTGLGKTVILPEKSVKDFMHICFADYSEDVPIPEIEGLTHVDGTYRYQDYNDPNESVNRGRTDYIILDMQYYKKDAYNDGDRFYMFVVSLDDADHFSGGKSWKVWLIKNDEPDRLGINWRVEKIVCLPAMTNGVDACGNG